MADIRIAAAASLTNGLPEIIASFTNNSTFSGINIIWVAYGGSYALQREILGIDASSPPNAVNPPLGADIFLTASNDAMDLIQQALPNSANPNGISLLEGPVSFISNTLVLIMNAAALPSLSAISSFASVAANIGSGHIWIPNPDNAPAGAYARAAFGNDWASLYGKAQADNTLASDVQTTLNGLIADQAPAVGVVYRSDFQNAPAASGLLFVANAPSNLFQIEYQAAVLSNATSHGVANEARAFYSHLNAVAYAILNPLGYAAP